MARMVTTLGAVGTVRCCSKDAFFEQTPSQRGTSSAQPHDLGGGMVPQLDDAAGTFPNNLAAHDHPPRNGLLLSSSRARRDMS